MENDSDKNQEPIWLSDLPVTSENIGFNPEEMNACPKCGKTNPPTRLSCFYCSADLETDGDGKHSEKLNLRGLEAWENGFNVVYLPGSADKTQPDISSIARLLSIESDFVRSITDAKSVIPIARLESPNEAAAAVEVLSRYGLECAVVGDDVLKSDKLPVRLRGLKFNDESVVLTLFNTNEETEIHRDEISLVVTGAIIEGKTETVEKRKKKKTAVVLETHATSDGGLVDLYTRRDHTGYRISINGFDFSCLGTDKGLLAAENIRRLTEVLKDFAPSAKFIGDYLTIRELLGEVWEIERRKDSHGQQRTGFGGKDFTKIESSNNLRQFTKYSRLQRHLL